MKKRLFMKIYGEVIGVDLRYNTQKLAKELGILGWIKNCEDRTVEVEIEGEENKLEECLDWCRLGSGHVKVDKVEYKWLDNKNEFKKFIIKY